MFQIIFLGKKFVESVGGLYIDNFIRELGVEKIQVLVRECSTYIDHLYNEQIRVL